MKTVRSAWGALKAEEEEEDDDNDNDGRQLRSTRGGEKSADPEPTPSEPAQPETDVAETHQDPAIPPPSGGGNGPLFDALLLAARGEPTFRLIVLQWVCDPTNPLIVLFSPPYTTAAGQGIPYLLAPVADLF